MKCFLISNMYPSQENPGYGIFIENIEKGLNKFNCNVVCKSVIKGRGASILQKITKYILFNLSIIFNFFRKYDFIYIHYPSYSALILLLLLKIRRKKLVVNYHGEDLLYDNNVYAKMLGSLADSLTKKYASMVIVPTEYYKNIVIQRELKQSSSIYISPSGGIDTNIFKPNNSEKYNSCFTIGFIGRLQEDKGILEYINACKELSKSIEIKAYIIGYGPLSETVQAIVNEDSSFILLNGLKQDQLPQYYNRFDLFCFPSKRKTESLGLVGIEAMACGVPVIGSNIGGIPTYLKNAENGYLLTLDNLTNDIINAVKTYNSLSITEKSQIISNCINTAKQYDKDIVLRQLTELFANF